MLKKKRKIHNAEKVKVLKRVLDSAPDGTKARLVSAFGYTHQNVADVIKKGRVDASQIDSLINAVKQASKDVYEDIRRANEKVQSI